MGDRFVYSIDSLKCQYASNDSPVLEIDELNIKQGKVYYFVGASGVGKSTLLETLGLMNQTALRLHDSRLTYYSDGKETDLLSLWGIGERQMSKFRREHLSFIFQSTNLFDNLTAFQNASISPIISGLDEERAQVKAKGILHQLYDDNFVEAIIQGRTVKEMSGGQRQRLAFARALGSSFQVLFADEPTGNLDHFNAHRLASIITEYAHEESKTAIIVSHDIGLAVEHADAIVLIAKVQEETSENNRIYGKIDASSVFEKNENSTWLNASKGQMSSEELLKHLKQAIQEIPS